MLQNVAINFPRIQKFVNILAREEIQKEPSPNRRKLDEEVVVQDRSSNQHSMTVNVDYILQNICKNEN